MTKPKTKSLFGGELKWSADDWTSSDDRVRGGKSHSFFEAEQCSGRFYGDLDIKTLGGAGFASQRTTGDDRDWDLASYAGILLDVDKADGKRYTFILKDELMPRSDNGREQATISYEYDFDTSSSVANAGKRTTEFVAWSDFKPTYRGKEKKDAKALDPANIKRISIMMRSFFGTQDGPFSISFNTISAVSSAPKILAGTLNEVDVEKGQSPSRGPPASRIPSLPWTLGIATLVTVAAIYVTYRKFVPSK